MASLDIAPDMLQQLVMPTVAMLTGIATAVRLALTAPVLSITSHLLVELDRASVQLAPK